MVHLCTEKNPQVCSIGESQVNDENPFSRAKVSSFLLPSPCEVARSLVSWTSFEKLGLFQCAMEWKKAENHWFRKNMCLMAEGINWDTLIYTQSGLKKFRKSIWVFQTVFRLSRNCLWNDICACHVKFYRKRKQCFMIKYFWFFIYCFISHKASCNW